MNSGETVNNIRIVTIEKKEDLTSKMQKDWLNHLAAIDDPRTFFQLPFIFFNPLSNNSRVTSTLAYLIYKDETLVGLLTFVEQQVQIKVSFGLFKLMSTTVNELRNIGSGIINYNEDSNNLKQVIINKLKQRAAINSSQIFLEAIEERDFLYGVTDKELKSFQLKESETFLAELEADFDCFLKNKTKSKRQSINKDLKRFEKNYPDRYAIKRNQSNFIRDAETILNNSWKKGLVGSIVGKSDFREQYDFLIEQNLVEAFILELDDSPIAFAIGYRVNQHFFYEEIAYDENFAKSGVGSYLTINVVKHLHKESNVNTPRYFSFGVGDNIYKRKLYNVKYSCEDRVLVLPNSKASLFLWLKTFVNTLYRGVRQGLLKLGVHQYIRQKLKQRKVK